MQGLYLLLILLVFQMVSPKCQTTYYRSARQDLYYKLSDKEELVGTVWPGIRLVVDSRDKMVSTSLRDTGDWGDFENYIRFVKEGDVVLNIGTHIGFEGMIMGKVIGPTGKIFFFQPYEVSRNILIKNIFLNDLYGYSTVYPIAASNKKMTAYLVVELTNTGGSNVATDDTLKDVDFKVDERKQIQVDMVDNVLPADLKVNLAFLDVQWLDVECLQGMKKTIERSPGMIIVTEWTAYSKLWPRDVYVQHLKDLLTWFDNLKYRYWKLGDGKTECNNRRFDEMTRQQLLVETDRLYQNKIFIDIAIVPGDIDPNTI